MADEIKVVITGKDGVSKVFQEVSKSADSMQKAITKDAAAAGTSLNKMSADAQKAATTTSRSFDDMGRGFAVAGAAIGASIALFSQQIVTNEQNVANLTRTYGAAAGQLQAFAQQIQSSTTFSSEAAIESANIFGTLARNYGISVEQIQQLIQVSTDLAATSGLSLQDTSQRVAAAIRGEAEAAEALGLTMNQAAIDHDNLTLSMSNTEAGAFRFNALMDQAAFAQGAAGEKAETTAGQMAQLNNKFQDLARGAISAAGPLPQLVGGLTSIGAESALAISGLAKLAEMLGKVAAAQKGAAAAGGAGSLFGGLSTAVGSGGLAAGLAAIATGALAVTAAFVPLAAALALAAHNASEYKADITEQTDAITAWAAAINDPALREGYTFLAQDIRDLDKAVQSIDDNTVHDITDAFDELMSLNPGDLAKLTEILHAAGIEIGNLENLSAEQLDIVYNAIVQVAKEHAAYQFQLAAGMQASMTAMGQQSVALGESEAAAKAASEEFVRLWLILQEGDVGARRAASGLNGVSDAADKTAGTVGRLVEIIDGLAETGSRDFDKIAQSFKDIKFPEIDNGDAKTITRDYADWRGETEELAVAQEKLDESMLGVEERMNDYLDVALKAADAIGMLSTNAQLFAASGVKTPSLDVAVNLQGGQGALEGVFSSIVGQTNAMAQQMSGVESWADKLIGDPGTWLQLDQLLTDNRISLDQYNQAQQAQVTITNANANAQQDLLAVQAQLAPVIAEAALNQARYIDGLQDLPEQQQLAALGYMDTAESAKAMGLAQLAAASTTDVMRAQTTAMIQQAAAADPVLKAMLEDMGLISATDGSVNFDTNAVDIGTAIEGLTASVDALTVAIGGVPPVHTDSNAPDTQKDVSNLTGEILGIPDSSTTYIIAVDNASGTIQEVGRQLRALDGQTARTFIENYTTNAVNNVITTTNVGPGTGNTAGRNGGVIGFADGGFVAAELAENGPELLRFANGGETIVPRRGLYSVPVGTSVLPSEATRATLRERGGGDVYIDMRGATINIEAADGDVAETWRSWAINQARTG